MHFSITTLVICGVALKYFSRWLARDRHTAPIGLLKDASAAKFRISLPVTNRYGQKVVRIANYGLATVQRIRLLFIILVMFVALRSWLFWLSIRTSQCARHGTVVSSGNPLGWK